MKSSNEIAVVLPCYNLGRTIEESIDSVLAQTRPASEMVIVDDGSSDILTQHTLARINHPRIQITKIVHSGVAAARNHGVQLSRAPYIVLLDADDVLAPDYLEKAASRLDADEGLAFVSCRVQAFEGANYIWEPPPCTVVHALTHGTVHISSMFRRSLWNALGGFDRELPAYEDLDFWLRALCLGLKGETIEEPLLYYRARNESRYHSGIEPEIYQVVMKRIIEKHNEVLNLKGTEVLLAKESFLLQLHDYQRSLIRRRDLLKNDLHALQCEIKDIRFTLEQKCKVYSLSEQLMRHEPQVAPDWEQSVAGRYFDQFLKDRRWLVQGKIAIICDSSTAHVGIESIRWDIGSEHKKEERYAFNNSDRLKRESFDCIILLALAFSGEFKSLVNKALEALKSGGSLLLAMPGLSYPTVMGAPESQFPAEQWLCKILAQVLPFDQFELMSLGNLTTLTAALHNLPALSLSDTVFNTQDRQYPVLVAGSAIKPGKDKHPKIHWHKRSWPTPKPKGAVILAYHRIASLESDTHQLCVPVDYFSAHMSYLRERCTVMPLEEVFCAVRDGGLPPRAVAITIDDGYLDALTIAAPILMENKLPVTFFVNTERLNIKHEMWHDTIERILLSETTIPPVLELMLSGHIYRMEVATMTQRLQALYALHGHFMAMPVADREEALDKLSHWAGIPFSTRDDHRLLLGEEVQTLSRMAGCAIGSHSAHHLLLVNQPVEVQRTELRQSKKCLEELIEKPVLSFCYPFGAYSTELVSEVRITPHLFGVTVQPGLVTPMTDPLLLPRYEIKGWSGTEFAVFIEHAFQGVEHINETHK